ncbi:RES family NAD+ phosphorylase [Elizabethkingia meningoseptica]|uniref:RES family NAD+ phosphorylase n=1 Tax=Elizabethkingia meningoseptica TaxID=238 RepID=UPI00301CFD33
MNSIIISNRKQGNCDYCQSENVHIYEPSELNRFFVGIIDLYEVDTEHGTLLETQILLDFHKKAFTQKLIESNKIKQLISEIIKDDIAEYQNILDNPVRLKIHNTNVEEEANQSLFLSWDNFSDEIKTVNRFHLKNSLDLEKLKSLFKHFEKSLPKSKKFFRARISDNPEGYPASKMGNPPNELAKSGRANPNGISYLYLSNDITTTLYEVRASLYDYVTVGTFRLEESINVINLSRSTYDIFRLAEEDSLQEVMIHGSFIDKLEQELSKPRRRSDSELDYLPTQYLSELIKSMGFDGIEFKSSLYSEGVNIAIFNPEKFKCLGVKVYDIENIELTYTSLIN